LEQEAKPCKQYVKQGLAFFAPLEAVQLSFIQSLSERPVWVLMTIDFIGFLCSRHFRVKHLNITQITINSVIIAYLVMAIIE
jgi:hypothetical protein